VEREEVRRGREKKHKQDTIKQSCKWQELGKTGRGKRGVKQKGEIQSEE
jgi:hypothetical protein